MVTTKEIVLPVELIPALIEGHDFPALIVNRSGNILSSNKKAREYFSIGADDLTFSELFSQSDREKVSKVIDSAFKFNGETREYLELLVKDRNISFEFVINLVKDQTNAKYLVIKILDPSSVMPAGRGKAGFGLTVHTEDLQNLVRNPKVLEIIESVKSSFPFTFLGKSKVQNEINKIPELFWIKDINNNFILVNTKFASLLGLKTQQLEGRPERSFLPQYYLDLYKTIDLYIRETLSYFILEGIPLKGFASLKNYQSIEFPLVDAENKISAIIGIGQRRDTGSAFDGLQKESIFESIFRNIPKPFLLIDTAGYIKSGTQSLESMFVTDETPLISKNVQEIFPESALRSIKAFISAGRQSQELSLKLNQKNGEEQEYAVTLTKISAEVQSNSRILIGIEKSSDFDNLEDLLTQRGRMYDILIQGNPESIYVYSTENLRFVDANHSALELYGYDREEFLNMDLTDLYTPEDIQTLLDSQNGNSGVNSFRGPYKHRRKDGSTVLVEISKTPFLIGGKEAHFNIVRDVSEKVTNEREYKLLKATYENTSDILMVTDNVGFLKEVNKAVHDKLGYDPHELIDTSFISLASDEHRGLINTSIFYSHSTDKINLSVTLKKKDLTPIKAEIVAIPIETSPGEIDFYNLIIRIENQVSEVVKEVEKIVIKEVIKEVEAGGQSGSMFPAKVGLDPAQLGTVFHEILTPINVILGFVQEIKDSIGNPTSEQQEAIDYITQNRDNLLDTMNTIAEFSKLNAPPEDSIVEIKAADLLEYISEEVEALGETQRKNLIFSKVSSSLVFQGYESLYKNFVLNLVKICFKISAENQIYISAQAVDENRFVLSVKDNVGKITADLLNNLVNLFNQSDISFVRSFNVSRYSANALKKAIAMLGGKVEILGKGGKPFEVGVIFPVTANEIISTPEAEPSADVEVVEPEEEIIEDEPLTFLSQSEGTANIEIGASQTNSQSPAASKKTEVQYEPIAHRVSESAPRKQPDSQVPSQKQTPVSESKFKPLANSPSTGAEGNLELKSMSCLYIEDQVDSQILFKVQMKELGKMDFAVSFEDALPLITSKKFDFIVMDINLQGEYNGLDALKMIHKMPGFETIPIIAVTAYVLPGDREKFIAAGFNDFISKPIFREKMLEALEKIFRKKIV